MFEGVSPLDGDSAHAVMAKRRLERAFGGVEQAPEEDAYMEPDDDDAVQTKGAS